MSQLLQRPPWRDCLSIIKDVCQRMGVDPDDVVMFRLRTPEVLRARRVAIRRILLETKCSQAGLSAVWGISVQVIRDALAEVDAKRAYTRPKTLQQAKKIDEAVERLHERLRWAHGDARAAQIVAGQDPKTNADLAAWKRLGGSLGQVEGRGL